MKNRYEYIIVLYEYIIVLVKYIMLLNLILSVLMCVNTWHKNCL